MESSILREISRKFILRLSFAWFAVLMQGQLSAQVSQQFVSRCNCNDGIYQDTVVLMAQSGLFWNLFSGSNATLDGPISEFSNGKYRLVINQDGDQDYIVNLSSSALDYLTIRGTSCQNRSLVISGPVSVCTGSQSTYNITGAAPTAAFDWLVTNASLVSSTPQSALVSFPNTSQNIIIQAIPINGQCGDTITYHVTAGAAYTEDFACKNAINVSLDEQCLYIPSIDDIIAGTVPEGSALAVLLEDASGKPVPGNTLNASHLGKTFVVKVIDGCGGNSCWGTLLLEDKKPPVLVCQSDITVNCYNMGDYPGPFVIEECSEYQVFGVGPDQVVNLNCDPELLQTITRKYIAIDEYGNSSDTCTQRIHVRKFPLEEVVFPADTAFDCALFSQNPLPAITGFPIIGSTVLDQLEYPSCKVFIDYKDQIISLPGKTKIIRTWTIYEWSCEGSNHVSEEQIIILKDQTPPIIVKCPADIKLSTKAHDCSADFVLPIPAASDIIENCNGTYKVAAAYSGGSFANILTMVKPTWNLPIGNHTIVYTVTDAAGLSSQCSFTVLVADRTPPVAVCKDSITVSLGHASSAVYPEMLDNQSYDACGLATKKVRRMDKIANSPEFKDSVHVTCEDVGKTIMIQLQVTDIYGNTNICMTSVKVEDKTPPILMVPDDVTIYCNEWLNNKDIKAYGEAVAYDQCDVTLTEAVDTVLNLCHVGKITRTFTATSGNQSVSKSQIIYVVQNDVDTSFKVIAPLDTVILNNCSITALHPDSLGLRDARYGKPLIVYGGCDLAGLHYSDKEYTIVDQVQNNCKKIIRSWKVINYCRGNGTEVVWQHDQIIKITNDVKPVITSTDPDTLIVETLDCLSGARIFSVAGSDDCTPLAQLRWNYQIKNTLRTGIVASGTGTGGKLSFTQNLEVGLYSILYTLTDGCGNFTELSKYVKVINTKGPLVYAYDSIATGLTAMIDVEMSCVNVKQLIIKSEHPCGLAVRYSFSRDDVNDTIRCFDCNDIGFNNIDIFGIDENGITGSARVVIEVQDNNDKNICASFADCITWPSDTLITACTSDLEPATIRSLPSVRPDCSCNTFNITKTDRTISSGACTTIERTFTVTFNCNGTTSAFRNIQIIKAINRGAPIVSCPAGPLRVNAVNGCEASFTAASPVILDDSCHTGIILAYRIGDGPVIQGSQATGVVPVGTTTITYIATDLCGNTGTCSFEVVAGDLAPPVCRVRDITIFLNNNGIANIGDASIFNNGSFDECNNLPLQFSVNRTSFSCDQLNVQTPVIVTVADASGNATTCPANVSVSDTMRPICVANNLVLDLTDEAPFAIITARDVIFSARDNCSLMDTIVSKVFFNCLDLGTQTIRTVVRDRMGNSGMCESTVTVRDRIKPVCVLQSDTLIVNGGSVTVTRENVDGGSFDPCGTIASFVISPSTFSCEDLGMQTVNITITDTAGNVTTCDTTIFLIDGSDPVCRAKDITVYLDINGMATISPEDVDNGSGTGCGNEPIITINRTSFTCSDVNTSVPVILTITNPVNNQTMVCTSIVTVLDTLIPTLICPPDEMTIPCSEYTGVIPETVPKAVMTGCGREGYEMEETIIKLATQCGIDTFTRTYRLFDPSGAIIATCVQIVRVVNDNPLSLSDFDLPPALVTVDNCVNLDPEEMDGGVMLKAGVDEGCSSIFITYADASSNVCNDTITRTWTIADKCKSFAPIIYIQKIVVNDITPPAILGARDMLFFNDGSCGAFVDLSAITIMDCDLNPDVSNKNSIGLDTSVLAPSGFYPIGIHIIILHATDKCGNASTDTITIEVRDTFQRPALVCLSDTVSIGAEGFVDITASDFAGVYGVCDTSSYDIKIVFRVGDDTTSSKRYVCEDIPTVGLLADTISIELYNGKNGADSLIEVCQTIIFIDDRNDQCMAPVAMIYGTLSTPQGVSVPEFKVIADGEKEQNFQMTDASGHYEIMQQTGSSIMIQPSKDGDANAGVNTLDLLHIKRHIQGLASFTTPHQFIASDINEDGNINVADMVEIQNLVLGRTDRFKFVSSWKAIDAGFAFANPVSSLEHRYPTAYEIDRFTSDMEINFTAVKMGDVNGSYVKNAREEVTSNRSALELQATMARLADGSYEHIITIPDDISAIEWIGNAAQVQSITSSDDRLWSASHNDGRSIRFIALPESEKETSMLKLKVITTTDVALGEVFSALSQSVVYDADEKPMHFSIVYEKQETPSIKPMVTVAYPNPWAVSTTIEFNASLAGLHVIRVYDLNGKMIVQKNVSTLAGQNKILLDRNDIPAAGIYEAVITSESSGQRSHQRLLVVD